MAIKSRRGPGLGRAAAVTQFEYVRPHSRSRLIKLSDAARIAGHLKRGGLAVLPTETGYMLAALATSPPAIERAFNVKQRPASHVMHVACSSLEMAETIGRLKPYAAHLLGELTPGPISVITEKTPRLPDRLVSLDGTVGIRIPDHPATLQIISAVGAPLTATSLNASGSAPASIDRADLELLNWPDGQVSYVVADDEAIVYDQPSTLVRLTGDDPEILRGGPISQAEIRDVLRQAGFVVAGNAT
jgi:L-threonylcarbamoyladenylate synthase